MFSYDSVITKLNQNISGPKILSVAFIEDDITGGGLLN